MSLRDILLKLSRVSMSPAEWRMLMIIISRTVVRSKPVSAIQLDEFVALSGVGKPHCHRALSNLVERNVISRISYGNLSSYSINTESDEWRSIIGIDYGKRVSDEILKAFEKWFNRYPNKIYENEARMLYVETINSDGISPLYLEESLTGYINLLLRRSEKFNENPDPLDAMYPTSFLRNKRYEEFHKYKDHKRRPRL